MTNQQLGLNRFDLLFLTFYCCWLSRINTIMIYQLINSFLSYSSHRSLNRFVLFTPIISEIFYDISVQNIVNTSSFWSFVISYSISKGVCLIKSFVLHSWSSYMVVWAFIFERANRNMTLNIFSVVICQYMIVDICLICQ